jgi:hypothetical protein
MGSLNFPALTFSSKYVSNHSLLRGHVLVRRARVKEIGDLSKSFLKKMFKVKKMLKFCWKVCESLEKVCWKFGESLVKVCWKFGESLVNVW